MIADRRHLAAQIQGLQLTLNELTEWTVRPDQQFPGDVVLVARQLCQLAHLLLSDAVGSGDPS